MNTATLAIIISAVALASSVLTLVCAVRIHSFMTLVHSRIRSAEAGIKQRVLYEFAVAEKNIKQHVTAVLSDLGLEKKPEQK